MRGTRIIRAVYIVTFAATVTHAQGFPCRVRNHSQFEDSAFAVQPDCSLANSETKFVMNIGSGTLILSERISLFVKPKKQFVNTADSYNHKSSHDSESKDVRPDGSKVECLYGKVSPRRGQVYMCSNVRNKQIRNADRQTNV